MAFKPKTKTSVSSEVVLGQASININKAVAELNTAAATLNGMVEKNDELALQIANKEESIEALAVKYKETERQLSTELDINMKSKAETVVYNFLSQNGKVAIARSEYDELNQELATIKSGLEASIKAEVAKATGAQKSTHEAEVKLLNAEYKAKEAENLAKIGTLSEKVSFLEAQNTMLLKQLDAERQAGIERAKAGSVGTINVGAGSNGR